ncbi:class I SAM-dependent methyltransferase [Nocardia salmonicida]|uniref:class I SAM-dependent methyltransferase n=1 Tax=Nocardia salmonicida TaxID=53431 RepID=UPI00368894CF
MGRARGCADGAQRRGRNRILRARRSGCDRSRTVGGHARATPRRLGALPGCRGERLSFADQSFDAAMAVSTVHHWRDPIGGLREIRRVARRVAAMAEPIGAVAEPVPIPWDCTDGLFEAFWRPTEGVFGGTCAPGGIDLDEGRTGGRAPGGA